MGSTQKNIIILHLPEQSAEIGKGFYSPDALPTTPQWLGIELRPRAPVIPRVSRKRNSLLQRRMDAFLDTCMNTQLLQKVVLKF